MTSENSSSPAIGYQEILRRLAIIDEGFVGDHAGALGYDIEAALEEPDDP